MTVRQSAVEAGITAFFISLSRSPRTSVVLSISKASVFTENDHFCSIHKFISQIIRHDDTVQIFASGCGIIFSCLACKVLTDQGKFLFQRKFQFQAVNDLLIALLDLTELPAEILPSAARA